MTGEEREEKQKCSVFVRVTRSIWQANPFLFEDSVAMELEEG